MAQLGLGGNFWERTSFYILCFVIILLPVLFQCNTVLFQCNTDICFCDIHNPCFTLKDTNCNYVVMVMFPFQITFFWQFLPIWRTFCEQNIHNWEFKCIYWPRDRLNYKDYQTPQLSIMTFPIRDEWLHARQPESGGIAKGSDLLPSDSLTLSLGFF